MNKWVGGFIIAVVVLLGGAFVLLKGQTSPETPATSSTSSTKTSSSSDQTATTAAAVEIKDFAFSPATLKVKKGTTVTWTNQDTTRHNATADSDSPLAGFDGPLLAKGETYSFTFDKVGTYHYHCTPHASTMKATIEVVD